MKAWTAGLLAALALGAVAGCDLPGMGPSLAAQLQSEDPDERIAAIHRAGKHNRTDLLPLLVERLDDSETEVRLFAELAVQKITGMTMGYHHYDPPAQRRAAIRRWREWLRHQGRKLPATQPAEGPGDGGSA